MTAVMPNTGMRDLAASPSEGIRELTNAELNVVSGGATMAEYGLLLALIAVVCISGVHSAPPAESTVSPTRMVAHTTAIA